MSRLALITGASSGIGAAFAAAVADRGYDLMLVARRREALERAAQSLQQAHGIQVEICTADLTSDQDLARVEQRIAAASNLELLVNNAGFGTRGKFFRAEVSGQDQMHRLHVLATMRLTHVALGGMVERGRGGVINVSSVAAYWQSPGSISYCATKCWINSFTEGLALELAGVNSPVKVQALCPGYTRSEFHQSAGMEMERVPKSLWMTAEEVVTASLRGLERGETFVVPGWRYKGLVFLMKHMPRVVLRSVAVRQMRQLGRD